MYDLRYYQREAVEAVYRHLETKDNNPCVVLPTGAGKSIVIAQVVHDAVTLWGGRVLVLAHVKELLEQNAGKIQSLCPDLKVCLWSAGLGSKDADGDIVVAGVQSAYKCPALLGRFDLILIDEVHMVPPDGEGTYRTLLNEEKNINPHVRLIGFTATPFRLAGGVICRPENLLNEVCYSVSVKELMMRGYLSKLINKGGSSKANLANLHIRAGDYVQSEIEARMDTDAIVRTAVREIIEKTADRRKALIFASGVKHAEHIAAEFKSIGHECGIVTGSLAKCDRDSVIQRFKSLESMETDLFGDPVPPLKYLVNVGVLTTGFDCPEVDCVALLRPTASAGLYYQMVGRGFRIAPGKTDCMILDYGGNIMRHGPVDLLEGDLRKAKDGKVQHQCPTVECPACHEVQHAQRKVCIACGADLPHAERDIHHSPLADGGALVSGERAEETYSVKWVNYDSHAKRGDASAPHTLMVTYGLGWNQVVQEYICVEHTGYAREKAEKWWREVSNLPCPRKAEHCVAAFKADLIRDPQKITVRRCAGDDFPRVVERIFAYGIPELTDYRMTEYKKLIDAVENPSYVEEERAEEEARMTQEQDWDEPSWDYDNNNNNNNNNNEEDGEIPF